MKNTDRPTTSPGTHTPNPCDERAHRAPRLSRWFGLAALALAMVFLPALAGASHDRPATLSVAEAVHTVSISIEDLARIEQAVARRCGSACDSEIWALGRVRTQLARAETTLERADERAPSYRGESYSYRVAPMRPADFSDFSERVSKAYYNSEKLEILEHQVHFSFFTSAQVNSLIKPLYYSSTKLDALKILAPRIVDPERSVEIYDSFYYSSNKSKARSIIEQAFGLNA